MRVHSHQPQAVHRRLGITISFKRNSANGDKFDVNIIHSNDHPFLRAREGQSFLRAGGMRVWHMEDLQSFTPLRFLPPELMGYEGRAVVVDPDVFAVGDVNELLDSRHGRQGDHVPKATAAGRGKKFATSVMLLDCAKLTHWQCEQQFNELFEGKRDYMDWILLHYEPEETIGLFEDEWNNFDQLTERTKLLHNTKRRTQPWKTGLPMDFTWAKEGRAPEAGDLAAPDQALDDGLAEDLQGRTPTATRSGSSSVCCANAWRRAWSPRSCCARRCAATTCATTRWSWSSAPRRSRHNAARSV